MWHRISINLIKMMKSFYNQLSLNLQTKAKNKLTIITQKINLNHNHHHKRIIFNLIRIQYLDLQMKKMIKTLKCTNKYMDSPQLDAVLNYSKIYHPKQNYQMNKNYKLA